KMVRESSSSIGNVGSNTRISIRSVAKTNLIRLLENVEAAIPIEGKEFSGFSIVYQGFNLPGRNGTERGVPSEEQLRQYKEIMRNSSKGMVAKNPAANNGSGIITERVCADDVRKNPEEFINLLSIHGYNTPEQVLNIVGNNENIVVVAKKNGRLIGITVGEAATIKLSNGNALKTMEITDSAILPEFQGNGAYSVLSAGLLRYISENWENMRLNAVYAETVIEERTLRVALNQGRVLSGILPFHAKLGDEYKSLVANYITRQSLESFCNISQLLRP
ncbi:MAG: hypothetical protein QXF01_02975, partial [Candidatus Micrarchaeaceae archaeon]